MASELRCEHGHTSPDRTCDSCVRLMAAVANAFFNPEITEVNDAHQG